MVITKTRAASKAGSQTKKSPRPPKIPKISTRMPPETPTSVFFLLDRTGSMFSIKDATIESFNGYLDGFGKSSNIKITLAQFDSIGFDVLCQSLDPAAVPRLTRETYKPRASTNLIDSAVKLIGLAAEGDHKGRKTVVCIQTDGQENCSIENRWEILKALVDEKTGAGWQFNFMGAGIDAYKDAARMGIQVSGTMSYSNTDNAKMKSAFVATVSNTMAFARGAAASTAYSSVQKSQAGDDYDPERKKPAKTKSRGTEQR